MIKEGEILTLDNNNKYVVVSSLIIDDINYIYIINQDNYSDVYYCRYDNNSLEVVEDIEIIKKITSMIAS